MQQGIPPSSTVIPSDLQQGKNDLRICSIQCCASDADQLLVFFQSATFTVAAHMMYSGLVMELDCLCSSCLVGGRVQGPAEIELTPLQ